MSALAITPDALSEELSALKAEADKRFAANDLALAEAKGREQGLADQLEAKASAYRSLLSTIEDKDVRIASLEKELEDARNSADEVAQQKLRAAGHDPIPVDSAPSKTVLEQYRAMNPGKERIDFRKKHKAELEQELAAEKRRTLV